jgi:RNA polymerase sigma factor (TIGR02999 family)
MARRRMAAERASHTLSPTALLHEAYLNLVDQSDADWQSRAHFFAVASQAMRRILIDHARRKKAKKRGGAHFDVTLSDELPAAGTVGDEMLELDLALSRLAEIESRQAQVVEMRFFGGLKHEEIAAVLGLSIPTVRRDWRLARAWLSRELAG